VSDDLKVAEEAKRERMWDARERWAALQNTISWAEAQQTVKRNTPIHQARSQAAKNSKFEANRVNTQRQSE
jgi:hypothetical protein